MYSGRYRPILIFQRDQRPWFMLYELLILSVNYSETSVIIRHTAHHNKPEDRYNCIQIHVRPKFYLMRPDSIFPTLL